MWATECCNSVYHTDALDVDKNDLEILGTGSRDWGVTWLMVPDVLEVFWTCFGSVWGPGGAPVLTDGG